MGKTAWSWVKDHAIAFIVVMSVVSGTVLTVVIADKKNEGLDTVLTGLTLIVSAAIFAAAVAAAVYAKPAYDLAIGQLRPPDLKFRQNIVQLPGPRQVKEVKKRRGFHVYEIPSPGYVSIIAEIVNCGIGAATYEFNFWAPTELRLSPGLGAGQYVVTGEKEFAFARRIKILSEHSVARGELDRSDTFVYSADLIIPAKPSPFPEGWPVRLIARGIVNDKIVIDYRLWLKPPHSEPEPSM